MFATVIPRIRMPKGSGGYDYRIPTEYISHIHRGSWVRIPWRKEIVDGIVVNIHDKTTVPEKKIRSIVDFGGKTPLPEDLIGMILWMTERYITAQGTVLHAFLPKTPKTKSIPLEHIAAPTPHSSQTTAWVPKQHIHRYKTPSGRDAYTESCIKTTIRSGKSAIIIVPHTIDIAPLTERLQNTFTQSIIVVHGGLSPARYRAIWHDILNAQAPIIVIGTRPAIGTPVHNLGIIIVHEADSKDHKQSDQHPRFDIRQAAIARAEAAIASIHIMAHAPRVEEYARTLPVLHTPFTFSEESLNENSSQPILVGMQAITGKHAEGPLTYASMEAIKNALHGKKRVLIFLNRRGVAGAVFCRICHTTVRCGACDISYTVRQQTLHCRRCGTNIPRFHTCTRCNTESLHTIGIGIDALKQRLVADIPGVRIEIVDAEEHTPETLPDADILIGTTALLHLAAEHHTPNTWGACIIAMADDLLAHPGFRVHEEAWRIVRTVQDIAEQDSATYHIQTMDPDAVNIRALLTPYKDHAIRELHTRSDRGYPPYGSLITITIPGSSDAEAKKEAVRIIQMLTKAKIPRISIAGPIPEHAQHKKPGMRYIVLIKAPYTTPELTALLYTLPDTHIIDRDPERIT